MRAEGLWADHTVEVPFDHVTLGCEAFALGARRPRRGVRRRPGATGCRFGLDLEWDTDGAVYPYPPGTTRYEVPCRVHGEVLVGDERIEFDAAGQRDHSWGVRDWWTLGWTWTAGLARGRHPLPRHPRAPGRRHGALPPGLRAAPGRPADRRRPHGLADLGAHGLPASDAVEVGDLRLDVEPVAFAPVLLDDGAGACPASPGRCAAFTDPATGRRGAGWTEWNQPQCRSGVPHAAQCEWTPVISLDRCSHRVLAAGGSSIPSSSSMTWASWGSSPSSSPSRVCSSGSSCRATRCCSPPGSWPRRRRSVDDALHLPLGWLLVGCFVAAVAGDQVGYLFGRGVGPALFRRPDSRFFKQDNVDKAQAFFDTYGAKTIVLARFVPIVRTFAPIVAGVSRMNYRTFVTFNVVGGFAWSIGVTLLGYFLGQVEFVEQNLELAILTVVAISVVPIALELWKAHKERRSVALDVAHDLVDPGLAELTREVVDPDGRLDDVFGPPTRGKLAARPAGRHLLEEERTLRDATRRFAHDPSEVPRARSMVRGLLATWGLAAEQGPIELAVSELVSNAIIHGLGLIDVRLAVAATTSAWRSPTRAAATRRRAAPAARRPSSSGAGAWTWSSACPTPGATAGTTAGPW